MVQPLPPAPAVSAPYRWGSREYLKWKEQKKSTPGVVQASAQGRLGRCSEDAPLSDSCALREADAAGGAGGLLGWVLGREELGGLGGLGWLPADFVAQR